MGLRLYSEFKSSNNKQYKIEIYDDEWTVASSSFNVTAEGFTLTYSGETDDIVSSIVGSECMIQAYNTSSTFDTFLTHLLEHQEDRFTIRILLHDGSSYNIYWTGIIVQDLITDTDDIKPRVVQITATDGIGFLANKLYEQKIDVTIEEFIESSVNAIGLGDLYASTDTFYATTLNVWDTNMTYSATSDPATLIRFDSQVYTEIEEDGTVIYANHLEILKELCIAFGARFYQKNGVFHFEQYVEKVGSSRYVTTYQHDGTKISTALVSDDVTLNQTTAVGARLAGNSFNFLPALKKVQIRYNQERASNLLANRLVYTSTTPRQNIGFVPHANNGRIGMNLLLSYQLTLNTTPPSVALEFYRPIWQIEIRVEDINNPGTFHYLKRDWVSGTVAGQIYGSTSWTTTASYYYIDAGIAINDATGLFLQGPASLVTPPLPVSGDVDIDVNFYQAVDAQNLVQTVPSYFDETITMEARQVSFINDTGLTNQVEVFSATNTDTDINSNLILDLGELRVSDSFGLQGSFYVYTGSTWVKSSVWRRGNSGSFVALYKLLTKEVLSLHKEPIERYDGSIIANTDFGQRLTFDSKTWVMLRGDFTANTDTWSGEWFVIDQDLTNITTDDPVGSGGGNTPALRVSSQQGTDEVINAKQLNVNDVDADGTLGVTGASTLGATSVGAFTTTNSVQVTINDVSAEPGQSETLTAANHCNFITYSGSNGTYTITLPDAESGLIMRFKTDDTIGANKTITLSPQSGQRIDGEGDYTMNRSYDGITLLGKNSDWFIIQKKEK